MEGIFSWVKNIVFFFLAVTLVEELLVDDKNKKYVRMAAGMIFILVVFSPVLKLLNASGSMDYFFQWESFKTAIGDADLIDGNDFDAGSLEQERSGLILQEYKNSLEEQICFLAQNQGVAVRDVTVSVDENMGSASFGSVLQVVLYVGTEVKETSGEDGAGETVEPVKKVEIGNGSSTVQNRDGGESFISGETAAGIKQMIGENYGVSTENIIIVEGGDPGE